MNESIMTDITDIRDYMFGGKAEFTLFSLVSNKHFTYKIINHSDKPEHSIRFVFFLAGSDNDSDWVYAGTLKRFFTKENNHNSLAQERKSWIEYTGRLEFNVTARSPDPGTSVMKAFSWFIRRLNHNTIAKDQVQFMHSGKCSACGRKLTTPESILTGMGPVCRSRL